MSVSAQLRSPGRSTHENADEGDDRRDGRDEPVLREREDEQPRRQEPRERHGADEAVLGYGDPVVLVALAVIHAVGPPRGAETDEAAEDEGDVRQAGDAFAPAVVPLETEGDRREEEEGDTPGV